ncbi:MAG: hypothetical protein AB7G47_13220 [Mycolicibacterium sp.]|uniref:hypothetical protein n=1 Tax=Mycolicibacterium sp. TaxID=2320850 RepID=UPI003D0CBE28
MAKSHPVVAELADGGRIEATDRELVPMGDCYAAREVTYSHPGSADRPACRIVFEIKQSIPVCTSLSLTAADNIETSVMPKHLTAISLENLRRDVYGYVGVFKANPETGELYRSIRQGSFRSDSNTADKATRRSKLESPEFLQRVADVHDSAPKGATVEAVMAAFNRKQRQALRYIREARDKGFINE